MKIRGILGIITLLALTFVQLGMGRHGQYDLEAQEQGDYGSPSIVRSKNKNAADAAKGVARGVKEASVDSTKDLLEETVSGTQEVPVTGTVEAARLGSAKVLDNTVKGAVKVATLGYAEVEHYEVEEPEAGSGEPTKIKFSF